MANFDFVKELISVGLIAAAEDILSTKDYPPFHPQLIDRGCTVVVTKGGSKHRLLLGSDGKVYGRYADDRRKPGKDRQGDEVVLPAANTFEDIPVKEYAARLKAWAVWDAERVRKENEQRR